MKTVSSSEVAWQEYPGQRSIKIMYQGLLRGEAGTPENYELSLNHFEQEGGAFSPRHRHNFEQFRLAFDLPLNYAPDQDIPPGQIGYFPEGAYYGPQTILNDANMLIVQFGGPSGSGYLNWDALMRATNELKEKGTFQKGYYTFTDEAGKRFNKDAYEAVWEHANGRDIKYPAPRYREPIIIDPEAFEWLPVSQSPGVEIKLFGVFGERRAAASQIKLASGSNFDLTTDGGPLLAYVLSGTLRADGRDLGVGSAVEALFGERVPVSAPEDTLLVTFAMSDFCSMSAKETSMAKSA